MLPDPNPLTQFSLYPVQRIARSMQRGGIDDEDFDESILPLALNDGAMVEDVSALIASDEFDYLKGHLSDYSIKELQRIKYAIVHRAAQYGLDENGGYVFADDLLKKSQNIVAENAALLRIIRPTSQKTQMISGTIRTDGTLITKALNDPLNFVDSPENQKHFTIRTSDLRNLESYSSSFRAAMQGLNWKYRMAVQMHEAGHFQNTEWKVRFFLWTAALEALFTSKGSNWRQHSGSLVVGERVKDLIGASTQIYANGELAPGLTDPHISVEDIIGEISCLRNHIAHGDKVPDCYLVPSSGRVDVNGPLAKAMVLIEAISFVVRKSLLKILADGLVSNFSDDSTLEAYYTGKSLRKSDLQSRGLQGFNCPS